MKRSDNNLEVHLYGVRYINNDKPVAMITTCSLSTKKVTAFMAEKKFRNVSFPHHKDMRLLM